MSTRDFSSAWSRAIGQGRCLAASRPHAIAYLAYFALGLILVRWSVDLNWDLLNYHVSSAHLLLNGGYFDHVHPSGPPHYWPPFVNLPGYFAYDVFGFQGGRIALLALHALFAPLSVSLLLTAVRREQPGEVERRIFLILAGALALGLLAPVTLSILGTTFHDLPMAILTALAMILALRGGFEPNLKRGALVAVVLAFGVALKLTNLVLALPFGLVFYGFVLGLAERKDKALAEAAVFGVTAAAATVLFMTPWAIVVWRETGSPTFPLLNSIFQSPLAEREFRDMTFVAKSAIDFLRTPLELASATPMATQEIAFRDVRFALCLYLVVPVAILAAARHGWRGLPKALVRFPVTGFFTVFTIMSWAIWDWTFGIHRYVIVLDMLVGLLLVRLALLLPGRAAIAAVGAMAALHVATLERGFWWSAPAPLDGSRGLTSMPPAFTDALVFLEDLPMGYVVTYLDPSSRSVLLTGAADSILSPRVEGPFGARIQALADREWSGGAWLLTSPNNRDGDPPEPILAGYGLVVTTDCRAVTTWAEHLEACRLARVSRKMVSPLGLEPRTP